MKLYQPSLNVCPTLSCYRCRTYLADQKDHSKLFSNSWILLHCIRKSKFLYHLPYLIITDWGLNTLQTNYSSSIWNLKKYFFRIAVNQQRKNIWPCRMAIHGFYHVQTHGVCQNHLGEAAPCIAIHSLRNNSFWDALSSFLSNSSVEDHFEHSKFSNLAWAKPQD